MPVPLARCWCVVLCGWQIECSTSLVLQSLVRLLVDCSETAHVSAGVQLHADDTVGVVEQVQTGRRQSVGRWTEVKHQVAGAACDSACCVRVHSAHPEPSSLLSTLLRVSSQTFDISWNAIGGGTDNRATMTQLSEYVSSSLCVRLLPCLFICLPSARALSKSAPKLSVCASLCCVRCQRTGRSPSPHAH